MGTSPAAGPRVGTTQVFRDQQVAQLPPVHPYIGDHAASVFAELNVRQLQHGEDAPIEAAMRADELMEAGDTEGRAVWLRIGRAIKELQSKERPEDAEVH